MYTQNIWHSAFWWIAMIIDAVVIALTSCIDQHLGDAAVFTVIINTLMGVQMFLGCNNPSIKGALTLPGDQSITLSGSYNPASAENRGDAADQD